jgi:hypothetical protein
MAPPGEQEGDALDAVEPFQDRREALAKMQDPGREIGRQVIETRMMRTRNDLNVARADRVDVEEGDDALVGMDDVRGRLAARDAAEQAIGVSAGDVGLPVVMRMASHELLSRGCWCAASGRPAEQERSAVREAPSAAQRPAGAPHSLRELNVRGHGFRVEGACGVVMAVEHGAGSGQ